MDLAEVEVIVVGAGPCGLLLANELGRRNVRTLVIDMKPGVATAPQANATQARSMEHYRRHGFADEVRTLGLPADYPTDVAYFTTFSGHELARHKMPSAGEAGQRVRQLFHIWNGPELPHRVAQSLVENVLWQKAIQLPGVTIVFNTKLTTFEEDVDGVVVTIDNTATGQVQTLRCKYLFAADGSQSAVRKQLGIRYAGADLVDRDFMGGRMLSIYLDAPAFYDRVAAPKAWMYWTFNGRRRALLAAIDGKGKFVLQTQLRVGERAEDITPDQARDLFCQAFGQELPVTVTGVASWLAGRALVAERFRAGRVLLGGDAVHLFTPTGGMGYNTAIEDAANAGWKLAAVVKGLASPALLDSYEAERKPVAERNTRFALEFADSIGLFVPSPAIEDAGEAGQAARARAGAYLQQHAQREFTIPGFSLGARYDTSPIIAHDATPRPPDAPSVYVPTGKPGGRAPHIWLRDGRSLFDRFGFEWTLLRLAAASVEVGHFQMAASRLGLELSILDLQEEDQARDLYNAPLALVRPDQIVAWRGSVASAEEAAGILMLVSNGAADLHA